MEWKALSKIKRFTPMSEVFITVGNPRFRLGNRKIYYMGNGFVITYSPKMFRVENLEAGDDFDKTEYGSEGEYAVSVSFFKSIEDLKSYFFLRNEHYDFIESEFGKTVEIVDDITTDSRLGELSSRLRIDSRGKGYSASESRTPIDGDFKFRNITLYWDKFEFLFFSQDKETQMGGFSFILVD